MKQNQVRLPGLDAIRGFGIILVVGIHAQDYASLRAQVDSLIPALTLLKEVFAIPVPLFYMVDGFLIARSQSRSVPPTFSEVIGKSARRLLIPWLIFNVLYGGLRWYAERKGIVDIHLLDGQPIGAVFMAIWKSHIASQLYFLPTLFLMRVAAFPCRKVLTGSIPRLILLGLAYIGLMRGLGFRLEDDPVNHAIVEFPYFILGCLLFRLETGEHRRGAPVTLAILSLVAIAQMYLPWPESWEGQSIYAAKFGICVALYLAFQSISGERSALGRLGRQSMQIYLLHSPILIKVVGVVAARLIGTDWRYAFVWCATLILTIVLTQALAQIPRSKILFGEA